MTTEQEQKPSVFWFTDDGIIQNMQNRTHARAGIESGGERGDETSVAVSL